MPLETEIKFSIPDKTALEQLALLESVDGFTVVAQGIKPHTDTYFDTAGHTLFAGMAVLRLRDKDCSRIMTYKARDEAHDPVSDAIHRRMEIECATEATPDDIIHGRTEHLPPVKALRDRFGGIVLSISMTAHNQRLVMNLVKEGVTMYEMVLDDVLFRGTGGESRIFELEVESIDGCEEELRHMEKWLRERFGLAPAGPSKYMLGMKLVGGV